MAKRTPFTSGDCIDCGRSTYGIGEYYMVRDEVWDKAVPDGARGMLCVGCLELRIGRKLCFLDFTLCPLNVDTFIAGNGSALLLDRMKRAPND